MVDAATTEAPAAVSTRRRRRWAILVALLLAVIGALVWFEPHKLFIDETVREAIPVVTTVPPPTGAGGSATTAPAPDATGEPVELRRGELISRDHSTSGTVRVLTLADGSRIVRFEGLATDNGPDLYVYLSANPAAGDEGAFDDDVVSLGRLKGNRGDQNYVVPVEVDLGRFRSVVIWCDRFNSAFGAADLSS